MRSNALLFTTLSFSLLACGSATPRHEHPEALSVTEHESHAQGHEAEAAIAGERVEPGAAGAQTECVDQGVPLTSGAEAIPVMKPCWTQAEKNTTYLRAADAHRKAAREHRTWAQQLVEVEAAACEGLGEIERHTSPFVRKPDILAVEQYAESGTPMGARVTFRKVSGLSKEWLEKSMRCHQARAAKLGYARDFMAHCPLAVNTIAISVTEVNNTVIATMRATDPVVAAEVYGRALLAGAADE